MKFRVLLGLMAVFCGLQPAFGFEIERRQDQSPTESSYAAIPYAMNMPGIGSFYGFAGSINNIYETEADAYIATMTGDLQGYTGGLFAVPLYFDWLSINYFTTNFTKASIESYGRGMDSKKEDMKRVFGDQIRYGGYALNVKLWEKRLQFYTTQGKGKSHLTKIYDAEGNLIADISGEAYEMTSSDYGGVLDYTDDRNDPRRGVRIEQRRANNPAKTDYDPSYTKIDSTFAFFIPVGKQSTWAWNYFASDAVVSKTGETDRAKIAQRIGVDCSLYPPGTAQLACQASLNEQVSQALANNQYGNATALGGVDFLRAYPQGRFYGAHTRFYGSELRWNFSDGSEPFDFFLAKGVRTIMQVAVFHERGTVADRTSDLGKTWKTATGAGFRLLMSSGFVFRFDVGTGDEGAASTLFFNYPWALLY